MKKFSDKCGNFPSSHQTAEKTIIVTQPSIWSRSSAKKAKNKLAAAVPIMKIKVQIFRSILIFVGG